jgi:molybdopterin synthase catalytic subunit
MDAPRIEILITHDPLARAAAPPDGCGALVEFSGIVRGTESGHAIDALEYEAYQPMAEREIERIAREILATHACAWVRVHHRIGVIPVGEIAILLQAASPHRQAAFAFATAFMDRLKQDVPIWKTKAIPAK